MGAHGSSCARRAPGLSHSVRGALRRLRGAIAVPAATTAGSRAGRRGDRHGPGGRHGDPLGDRPRGGSYRRPPGCGTARFRRLRCRGRRCRDLLSSRPRVLAAAGGEPRTSFGSRSACAALRQPGARRCRYTAVRLRLRLGARRRIGRLYPGNGAIGANGGPVRPLPL